MYLPTYGELKSNIERQLDLQGEVFVRPNEILDYFNEGIDELEALIHTIYEDYFRVSTFLNIVSGTDAYVLPEDIYAQKIRLVQYINGNNIYEVNRIRDIKQIPYIVPNDWYQYDLVNTAALGPQIVFYPLPNFTSNSIIKMWYLRNAKRFTGNLNETCDIPEFTHVLCQYVRWKCYQKEVHPMTEQAGVDLDNMKMLMIETLSSRVPDENNKIRPDVSFYLDADSYDWGYYGF